jgi:hypothetical protein
VTAEIPRAGAVADVYDADDADDVETVRYAADGARVLEEAC